MIEICEKFVQVHALANFLTQTKRLHRYFYAEKKNNLTTIVGEFHILSSIFLSNRMFCGSCVAVLFVDNRLICALSLPRD